MHFDERCVILKILMKGHYTSYISITLGHRKNLRLQWYFPVNMISERLRLRVFVALFTSQLKVSFAKIRGDYETEESAQSSLVLIRPLITRTDIRLIRIWVDKKLPCPCGWVMECLYFSFRENELLWNYIWVTCLVEDDVDRCILGIYISYTFFICSDAWKTT